MRFFISLIFNKIILEEAYPTNDSYTHAWDGADGWRICICFSNQLGFMCSFHAESNSSFTEVLPRKAVWLNSIDFVSNGGAVPKILKAIISMKMLLSSSSPCICWYNRWEPFTLYILYIWYKHVNVYRSICLLCISLSCSYVAAKWQMSEIEYHSQKCWRGTVFSKLQLHE